MVDAVRDSNNEDAAVIRVVRPAITCPSTILGATRPENPFCQTQCAIRQLRTGTSAQIVVAPVVQLGIEQLHEFAGVQLSSDKRRSQQRDAQTRLRRRQRQLSVLE